MKNSKAVYVTIQDIKANVTRKHDVYEKRVDKSDKDYLETSYELNKDFSCQYDCKDTVICTCKRTKRRESRYFNTSRQVYRSQRYSSSRGFTDIGVGSVKTFPQKRVRRIYLPETDDRGVGTSNLALFVNKKTRDWASSYYDQKKTSSKCVGGVMDITTSVLSKKLSPIFQTKSGTTSPAGTSFERYKNIVNYSILENKISKSSDSIKRKKTDKHSTSTALTENNQNYRVQTTNEIKPVKEIAVNDGKDFSSDSLVQHVHNLEDPGSYKQSKTSVELIENKLEREYRKIFLTKPKEQKPSAEVKPIQDFKSASLLRRRFEALRRGLSKKEDSKKDCVVTKTSSQASVVSNKDVSIASDPPSLEARSYSNTKIFSPIASHIHQYQPYSSYRKSLSSKKQNDSFWSTDVVDTDYQSAKGMFKLWGKKFNLEEDNYKKITPYNSSDTTKKQKKKVELILPVEEDIENERKEAKRFSFFKRKNKCKSKQPYKSKKGVTAGRCEVGDGLMIKIGAANTFSPTVPITKCENISDDYDDILRKGWLKRFLANNIDSNNSVKVRWNNDMYATSSSTIFELMECMYKNAGIVFRSKSEITMGESSYYHSSTKPQVNFMQQSIEAWMIPKMIMDKKIETINICNPKKEKKKNIEVSFSSQKWFIDKSQAFSRKIEIVLHSNNLVKNNIDDSSEYIMIDIPKGYFSETSSDDEVQSQSSDERVYNIVEYETVKSSAVLNTKKTYDRKMHTGDHESNNIHVTVSVKDSEDNESKILETVIKKPPLHRDVVVQGSNVYLPKRCDVIGVGIITQRDIRDIRKPILKIKEIIDDESTHTLPPQKKCELAESYLQDYYQHWTPLGIDLFSWCISDSHLRGSSDNNSLNSFNNQGDGSKSCPNIYDDYQASTIVSSCATSSCSHCMAFDEEKKTHDDSKGMKFFNKFKKKIVEDQDRKKPLSTAEGKRVLPKDSVEVFKRRKIYATSNKSKWGVNDDRSEPYSVPSIEDKGAQNTLSECPKVMKPCCRPAEPKSKKQCKKHVSLQDCDVMNEILQEQLQDKVVEGILSFKGVAGCDICKKKDPEGPKHAHVIPSPICEMPQPPCIESCTKKRKPACSKKNSLTCNVPPPPTCPAGSPSPCQPKPCPPSPPPCALVPPCLRSTHSPPRSQCRSPSHSPRHSLARCTPPRSKSPVKKSPPSYMEPPLLCAKSPPCSTPPCARPKPIPPRIHSPQSSAKKPPCACPKKKSPCGLSQCPSVNKTPYIQETPSHYKAPLVKKSSDDICKKSSSHNFPWPLKKNRSKTPSPKDSGMSLKISPKGPISLSPSKCANAIKRLIQKFSNSSMQKECRPDCANKLKVSKRVCPPPPPPTVKTIPPVNAKSQPKMTGVHLKKMPLISSNECEPSCNIIRLNSKENVTIKMKKQTPSTEEIREGCNIKVQDEDGQTLYERRDYKTSTDKARTHLVKDMYRESQIQRVSTSNTDMVLTEKQLESCESKSNNNVIEINFNLKFKQGDKATAVNIKNCGDLPKDIQNEHESNQHDSPKDVYIIQDDVTPAVKESEKRDVNIKIVIKSYQPNLNKSKRITKNFTNLAVNDDFSRKISEKFHTVSTGYSDGLEQQEYSVHRIKINLTNSTDKLLKPSEELVHEELIEKKQINLSDSGSVTKRSAFECSVSLVAACTENEDALSGNDISQNKFSKINLENRTETNDEKSATGMSTTDNDELFMSDTQPSNVKVLNVRDKEQKKKILKRIFENSNDVKKNNKNKMRSIRQMLRAVFTSDSSGYEDVPVNNELAEELTYASLKPNFFKDSNSMTKYYQLDTSMTLKKSSENKLDEIQYPTEQSNSGYSVDSYTNEDVGCLCSHLAAKLNMNENNHITACCCKGVDKKDEEVGCNITDEDTLNRTKYVDAQTQDSQYKSSKLKRSIIKIASKTVAKKSQDTINGKLLRNITKLPEKVFSSGVKGCPIRNINKQTVLGLSEDEQVIILDSNNGKSRSKVTGGYRNVKPLDILQLHETKKAVLEIYAEKTVCDKGERTVAKLPKFIYSKESKLCNYEEMVDGYQHVSKRNIVMMSITH